MGTNSTEQLPPTDAARGPSMNWVMVLWAIAFMAVVIFGVGTYLLSWWFQRGL
jgi:hypothetical protein